MNILVNESREKHTLDNLKQKYLLILYTLLLIINIWKKITASNNMSISFEKAQSVYQTKKLHKLIVPSHLNHSITRIQSLHQQSNNSICSILKRKNFFASANEKRDNNSLSTTGIVTNHKKITYPAQPTRQKAEYFRQKLQSKLSEISESPSQDEKKFQHLHIYLEILEEIASGIPTFAELLKTIKNSILSIYSDNSTEDFQMKYIDQANQSAKLLKSIESLKNEKKNLIKKLNTWEECYNKTLIESQNFQVKIQYLESKLKQFGKNCVDPEKMLDSINKQSEQIKSLEVQLEEEVLIEIKLRKIIELVKGKGFDLHDIFISVEKEFSSENS